MASVCASSWLLISFANVTILFPFPLCFYSTLLIACVCCYCWFIFRYVPVRLKSIAFWFWFSEDTQNNIINLLKKWDVIAIYHKRYFEQIESLLKCDGVLWKLIDILYVRTWHHLSYVCKTRTCTWDFFLMSSPKKWTIFGIIDSLTVANAIFFIRIYHMMLG